MQFILGNGVSTSLLVLFDKQIQSETGFIFEIASGKNESHE
jgi:hypothetical protein